MNRIFSVRRTTDQLRQVTPGESDGVLYYCAASVLALLMTQYSIWAGGPPGPHFVAESLVNLIIVAFGVYYLWTCNGRNTGRDFIVRAIFLSVPVGTVMFLFQLLLGTVLYEFASSIFGGGHFRDSARAYTYVTYALSYASYAVHWLWIGAVLKYLKVRIEP